MRISSIVLAALLVASVMCACDPTTTCSNECVNDGFTLKGGDATKPCNAPTDCATGNKCGGATLVKACLTIGYVNNANVCALPSATQCVKAGDNLCKYPQSICATTVGVVKSTANTDCVLPKDADCLKADSGLCNAPTNTCIATLAFTKSGTNNDCVAPTDCKAKNNLCGTGKTYCISKGYAKGTADDNCVCDTTKNTETNNTCTANKSNALLLSVSFILALSALLF